jgi:hypothetical protein
MIMIIKPQILDDLDLRLQRVCGSTLVELEMIYAFWLDRTLSGAIAGDLYTGPATGPTSPAAVTTRGRGFRRSKIISR